MSKYFMSKYSGLYIFEYKNIQDNWKNIKELLLQRLETEDFDNKALLCESLSSLDTLANTTAEDFCLIFSNNGIGAYDFPYAIKNDYVLWSYGDNVNRITNLISGIIGPLIKDSEFADLCMNL